MTRRSVAAHVLLVLIAAGVGSQVLGGVWFATASQQASGAPTFEVDPTWPQPSQQLGAGYFNQRLRRSTRSCVDHSPVSTCRPRSSRPRVAPPVLEFDENGKFVQAWGGPSDVYEWPDLEHGITVDDKDHVWITGSNPVFPSGSPRSDDMLLKLTTKGKFVSQFGRRDQSGGNKDTEM